MKTLLKSTAFLFLAFVIASFALAQSKTKSTKVAFDVKGFTENLKFSLADKQADSNQAVRLIFTNFRTHPSEHEKQRGDGISESFMRGNEALASNISWGKGLVFRHGNTDLGQRFDISSHGIKARDVGQIAYRWRMDNNDAWDVGMEVYVQLANNDTYLVGAHYWNIHENANDGTIGLAW